MWKFANDFSILLDQVLSTDLLVMNGKLLQWSQTHRTGRAYGCNERGGCSEGYEGGEYCEYGIQVVHVSILMFSWLYVIHWENHCEPFLKAPNCISAPQNLYCQNALWCFLFYLFILFTLHVRMQYHSKL